MNINTGLIRKVFKIKVIVMDIFSIIPIFLLEGCNVIIRNKCSPFSSNQLAYFISEKRFYKVLKSIEPLFVCQAFFPVHMVFQKEAASFSCNLTVRALFLKTVIALDMQQKSLMSASHFSTQSIKKYTQELTFSKIKSIASSRTFLSGRGLFLQMHVGEEYDDTGTV